MDFLLFKEKTELKHKIDSLERANVQTELSSEQLKQIKLDFAEKSANRIEIGMEKYKKEMDDLVQSKLDSENKEDAK